MNDKAQHDVVIMGGGAAGMIAANRAGQLGLRAVVLEQGTAAKYLCNSRYTGGTFHICLQDIMKEEAVLKAKILESTAGFVKPELAEIMAREGRRVIRWLQDEGTRFMRASGAEYHKWTLAPPGRSRPGLDWEGRSGDVLLQLLERNLRPRGGQVVRGARGRSLIMENERCAGVVVEVNGVEVPFRGAAVFIADGGFQGNPDLVRRFISPRPDRVKQRGAGTGRGDGLQMATAVGAALVGTDRFYGHVLSPDAMTNDRLWPYPYLDGVVTAGIVVGADGRRFVDEGRGGVYAANALARLDDPMSSFVIFDSVIWDKAGRHGIIAPNPHFEREGATLYRADTLAALALAARLPEEALTLAVSAHNDAIAGKGTQTPSRTTTRYEACPIARAPFYAAPLCPGITNTMGGIRVNAHAQALREDGSVIEGLYALGAATGGLEGGPELGYVGGLSKAGVTALVAAEHVAALHNGYSY